MSETKMSRIFYTLAVLATCLLVLFVTLVLTSARPALSQKQLPRQDILAFQKVPHANLAEEISESLKIVTYNIGYASGRKNNLGRVLSIREVQKNLEEIAATLDQAHADVILLQEVDFASSRSFNIDQLHYLARRLGLPFAAYATTWNKVYVPWPYWPRSLHFGRIVSGQVILSRYPIEKQEILKFKKPNENPFWYNLFYLDRLVQRLTLSIGKTKISVYNVHLEAFKQDTRLGQLNKLGEWIKQDKTKTKIIAGDFNISLSPQPSLKHQGRAELQNFEKDLQINLANPNPTDATFPSWNPEEKIDHIFYSDDLRPVDSGTATGVTASDHLAVWGSFFK